MGTVGALCVVSPHGVPVLIRCVGSAPPPRTDLIGVLNAVYQSVKQQSIDADDLGDDDLRDDKPLIRPALQLEQLRGLDVRISFRCYSPSDLLLVAIENGAAGHGDALGGTAMLDMCYSAIELLLGKHAGLRTARENSRAFEAQLRGIAYYIDTIIGEDNLLGTGGGSRAVTAVEDRRLRKSIVGTSVAIRAPSVSVSPYEAVFALRKLLSPWTNQVGAFAAALAIGPGGSFICSSESGVAAATESWFEQLSPAQLSVLQLLWAHHVASGRDEARVSNVWLDSFIDESENEAVCFFAFPLFDQIELLVLAHPKSPVAAGATKRFAAPPDSIGRTLLSGAALDQLRICSASMPAGVPRSVEIDHGVWGFIILLPCPGPNLLTARAADGSSHHQYGKRAIICTDPESFAVHGGPAADTSFSTNIDEPQRRALLHSFFSHAAAILPRMSWASSEVGAMEAKGGPGPNTPEVYMCAEDFSLAAATRPGGTILALLSPIVPRYAMLPLAEELLLDVLKVCGHPGS